MKIGIGIGLSVLTFFTAKKYILLCQSLLTENNVDKAALAEDQFWIYSLIFGLTALVTIAVLLMTSITWKASLLIFTLNILVGFTSNIFLLNYLSQYSIAPEIANEFTLSYDTLFTIPTLFLTPLFLVNLFRYINCGKVLEKVSSSKEIRIDFRIKRFLGNIADIALCLGINFLLVKLGVFVEYLFSFVITYFLYKYILEASIATTIGKNLFNLMVLSSTSKELKNWHFMVRNVCRVIPFYAFPVLLNKPGIHDLISGTRVTELKS